jgi:hypothetical protein
MQFTAARGLALERCLRLVDSAAESLNFSADEVRQPLGLVLAFEVR